MSGGAANTHMTSQGNTQIEGGAKLEPVGGRKATRRPPRGLAIRRQFTHAGRDPFDSVAWELRSAKITDEQGEIVFELQVSRRAYRSFRLPDLYTPPRY